MNALEIENRLLNLLGEICRNARAQQFVDRRGEHLDTGLDDHDGNQGAQNTIERYSPQQHHTSRDERCQGYNGIKQRIGAGGNQRIALQLFALVLHVSAEDELHHDGHHDDYERGCRV